MSDLIDRCDVLGVISCFFEDSFIEDADVHCAELEREINRIPAAPRWVRCEERLPEREGDYLVFTNLYGGHAYTDYYSPNYGWDEYEVVAWMNLPEPPREDV